MDGVVGAIGSEERNAFEAQCHDGNKCHSILKKDSGVCVSSVLELWDQKPNRLMKCHHDYLVQTVRDTNEKLLLVAMQHEVIVEKNNMVCFLCAKKIRKLLILVPKSQTF